MCLLLLVELMSRRSHATSVQVALRWLMCWCCSRSTTRTHSSDGISHTSQCNSSQAIKSAKSAAAHTLDSVHHSRLLTSVSTARTGRYSSTLHATEATARSITRAHGECSHLPRVSTAAPAAPTVLPCSTSPALSPSPPDWPPSSCILPPPTVAWVRGRDARGRPDRSGPSRPPSDAALASTHSHRP